jgi:Ca2+-binding EF-hand superfamily protein
MAHELTFEQIQSCKKVFDSKKIPNGEDGENAKMYFDNLKEAIDDLSELKQKLTDEECVEIQNTMKLGDKIDFPTFLRIAAIKFKKQEFLNAIVESFKAFDKHNKGVLTLDELRAILTDHGPQISDDEVDELLGDLDLLNEFDFNYKDFVNNNI